LLLPSGQQHLCLINLEGKCGKGRQGRKEEEGGEEMRGESKGREESEGRKGRK